MFAIESTCPTFTQFIAHLIVRYKADFTCKRTSRSGTTSERALRCETFYTATNFKVDLNLNKKKHKPNPLLLLLVSLKLRPYVAIPRLIFVLGAPFFIQ